YAREISEGGAINKCPPGGSRTIAKLAQLLHRDVVPLDPVHGVESVRLVASIRENECIGCTKCIQACPVDAILGASKRMHTVIVDECTGCDLCVEPCPVDCIDMLPVSGDVAARDEDEALRRQQSDYWRQRFEARNRRLEKQRSALLARRKLAAETARRLLQEEPSQPVEVGVWIPPQERPVILSETQAKADIAAALARVRARKAAQQKEEP
ncbi:MAG: RnfABCDGE type electron transport complex subunit B, partial [Pseudomonadales bacterium]|nr:RnfABCDGE type electron transport complex subunit B [Pseudomonadales bacterium]